MAYFIKGLFRSHVTLNVMEIENDFNSLKFVFFNLLFLDNSSLELLIGFMSIASIPFSLPGVVNSTIICMTSEPIAGFTGSILSHCVESPELFNVTL